MRYFKPDYSAGLTVSAAAQERTASAIAAQTNGFVVGSIPVIR